MALSWKYLFYFLLWRKLLWQPWTIHHFHFPFYIRSTIITVYNSRIMHIFPKIWNGIYAKIQLLRHLQLLIPIIFATIRLYWFYQLEGVGCSGKNFIYYFYIIIKQITFFSRSTNSLPWVLFPEWWHHILHPWWQYNSEIILSNITHRRNQNGCINCGRITMTYLISFKRHSALKIVFLIKWNVKFIKIYLYYSSCFRKTVNFA